MNDTNTVDEEKVRYLLSSTSLINFIRELCIVKPVMNYDGLLRVINRHSRVFLKTSPDKVEELYKQLTKEEWSFMIELNKQFEQSEEDLMAEEHEDDVDYFVNLLRKNGYKATKTKQGRGSA